MKDRLSRRGCDAQGEFEGVRREMEKEAVRASKLEGRVAVLTRGYATREAALRSDIAALWDAAQAAEQVLPCQSFNRAFGLSK